MKQLIAIVYVCGLSLSAVHGETLKWVGEPPEILYSGDSSNGVPQGHGTATRNDGSRYSGRWKDGLPHGRGTLTLSDGQKFVGKFMEGSLNGQGTHLLPTGVKRYVGQFRANKYHGSGIYFDLDNGIKITGEFREGKAHGQGTATVLNTRCKESNCIYKGQRFVGEIRNYKPWNGVTYNPSGEIIYKAINGVSHKVESDLATQPTIKLPKRAASTKGILDTLKNFVFDQNNSQPDDGTTAYERGDYVTAYKRAFLLAEQGDAQAQFNIASLYMDGLGVPKNPVLAATWVEKAAIQGHYLALVQIGSMYSDGVGVLQNSRRAEYFWKQAVEKGSLDAAWGLAYLYNTGGDLENKLLQYVYLKIAQALGHEGAKSVLAQIRKGERQYQVKWFSDYVITKGDKMAQNIWAKIKAARGF